MKQIRKDAPSGHNWEKTNLTTILRNKKMFDEYICKNCGLKGKSYNIETIEFKDNVSDAKIDLCQKASSFIVPKKIRITTCRAIGKQFENLTPDSEHLVITPPKSYKNDRSGVWVMGIGEPVKVLSNEFIVID
jgi:hypothetical protein